MVDFAGTLGRLLRNKAPRASEVPERVPRMKADLASATSGGQWSQRGARGPNGAWKTEDASCAWKHQVRLSTDLGAAAPGP